MDSGYYRFPTVYNDQIVFVSEDDLWTAPLAGGVARRLTSGLGSITRPAFSPDGKWLAFDSAEEGHREVYLMPASGGPIRRLTYGGGMSQVTGWLQNQEILFYTDAFSFARMAGLARVSVDGGLSKPLNLGPSSSLAQHASGAVVVERGHRRAEPAFWKRYRGGTAGKFFFANSLKDDFTPFLQDLGGNLARPLWVGDRLFFISDHEGIGNLYSCTARGEQVQRETHFRDFYVRNISTDGKTIVFHAGADLYRFHSGQTQKIEIVYTSQRVQRQRRTVEAAEFLETCSLSSDGRSLAITARGHVAAFANWQGPLTWIGQKPGVRYRLGQWFDDDHKIAMICDEGGEEKIEVFDFETRASRQYTVEFGRAVRLKPAPQGAKHLALTNHRNELIIVDLESETATAIARDKFHAINGFNWSPDGRYLAFALRESTSASSIQIFEVGSGRCVPVTKAQFVDKQPVFDPLGRYLYYFSKREFDPSYDHLQFDLGFQKSTVICALSLQNNRPSPLLATDETDKKAKPGPVKIDFEGIENRVVRLPVPADRYLSLAATRERVFFSAKTMEGALNDEFGPQAPKTKNHIHYFDLKTKKVESFLTHMTSFTLSADRSRMLVQAGKALRVVKTEERVKKSRRNEEFSEAKGWINLQRMKLLVSPPSEWRQMLHEVWRLQRDHFWREDMSKIEWQSAYNTYKPLIERIGTRSEFADLVWELQGELGTSHAYEMGGDYRREPKFTLGFLGARFSWTGRAYQIERLIGQSLADPKATSPLRTPGVMAEVGDTIVSIQGRTLSENLTPQEALMNLADQEIEIGLTRRGENKVEFHRVRTLKSDELAKYLDWVETRRAYVEEKTGGRVGYIHIPDMGPKGFAEFHRHFLRDFEKDGLIVDVRFNAGGNVSPLLLQKLNRKRLGFDEARWTERQPYPPESSAGPMVALTNEFAGSDGDIFSHSFKLMKLGPLLGTRTWGGVVGINPRHGLVDGGITTQPEYSFWFKDVGWNVENYGTAPDIFIDNLPHHYQREEDQQLDRAIEEISKLLKAQPPFRPEVTEFPDLRAKIFH